MIISLNGDHLPAEDATVGISDRGFLLGDGLFETFRVNGGTIHAVDRHLERLLHGLALRGIASPCSDDEFKRRLAGIVAANRLQDGSLRLTVTTGRGPRGLQAPEEPDFTVLITASAGLPGRLLPAEIGFATTTRRNEFSPLSRMKSLNYMDGILAKDEARRNGWDDAVMLNTVGRVCETSIANLFLVKGDRLLTPSVEEGALPGVVRDLVIDCAPEFGFSVSAGQIVVDDVLSADGVFLTNSLIGLRPVKRCADRDYAVFVSEPGSVATLNSLERRVFS